MRRFVVGVLAAAALFLGIAGPAIVSAEVAPNQPLICERFPDRAPGVVVSGVRMCHDCVVANGTGIYDLGNGNQLTVNEVMNNVNGRLEMPYPFGVAPTAPYVQTPNGVFAPGDPDGAQYNVCGWFRF